MCERWGAEGRGRVSKLPKFVYQKFMNMFRNVLRVSCTSRWTGEESRNSVPGKSGNFVLRQFSVSGPNNFKKI
jgi:hypothetical protein